ncbi:hypothetical protein F4818DRAFT_34425 [Hypoxylon cercidicola]|nr:hypothetical protein F4818DRAFT_34425 [Hypoxylon cercidicola]
METYMPSSVSERPKSAASSHSATSDRPSKTSVSVSSVSRNDDPAEDEKKSGFGKRFIGNMLAVRVGRASVQSVASTVKMPVYLSAWGDNNPLTLPNLRKRDIALAGLMHFGVDALLESSLIAVDAIVQHAGTMTAERGIDEGLDKARGKKPHAVVHRPGVTNIEIHIRHKLIGEHAELRPFEERDTKHWTSCAKGWFCPYLYASSRAPQLPRSKDFTMMEFLGPGLAADAELAPMLLNSITPQDTPICALCSIELGAESIPRYRRLAVFFVGIAPYRTQSAWSQAKLPSEARLHMAVLTHIPAIVLPVKPDAPVCAWSPWTMKSIVGGKEGYSAKEHGAEMLRYIETQLDEALVEDKIRSNWRQILQTALDGMIDGVQHAPSELGKIANVFDSERAGFVAFRY